MISFLSVFPPFRGGISRFSDHVFEELKKYNTVHAINYIRQYPRILFPGKTQLLSEKKAHDSKRLIHAYNPINWLNFKFQQEDSFSHFIYSQWHPFFIPSTLAVIKKVQKHSPQVKISGIVHNVLPHESFPIQNQLVSALFRKTDTIFTLSSQGSGAAQLISTSSGKIKQLFHPIYEKQVILTEKSTLRKLYGIPENANVLLFFGLIREYKGLSILIEAFNKIAETRKDMYLLIAGEFYEPQNEYEEQIRPEFMDRVQIKNYFLSDKEAAEILTLSDILILPYKSATQSGVLADAIAYGLPAIATNEPGFNDFIENDRSGIIMKTRTSEELAQILLQIKFSDLEIFRNNLENVKSKFSWLQFGEELFQELYKI